VLVSDELAGGGAKGDEPRGSGQRPAAMDRQRHGWREGAHPATEAHHQRGAKVG
jgi:hypothetical protein